MSSKTVTLSKNNKSIKLNTTYIQSNKEYFETVFFLGDQNDIDKENYLTMFYKFKDLKTILCDLSISNYDDKYSSFDMHLQEIQEKKIEDEKTYTLIFKKHEEKNIVEKTEEN